MSRWWMSDNLQPLPKVLYTSHHPAISNPIQPIIMLHNITVLLDSPPGTVCLWVADRSLGHFLWTILMMIGRSGEMSNDVSQVLSQLIFPLSPSQHLFTVSWIATHTESWKLTRCRESSERVFKLLLTASSKSPQKGGRGMAKLL